MLKNFKITFIAIFYVFMVASSAANDNGEGIWLHAFEQALRDEQPVPDDEHEDALARYFNEALLIDEYEDDDPPEIYFEEAIANELEREARRRRFLRSRITRRSLRDHSDAFQMDPEAFRKLYRLWPQPARILVELLREPLAVNRQTKIPTHLQVLITLRFLAEGGFQKGVGQDYNHPVSQSRVSYIVNRVINAILTLKNNWIVFPNNRESRLQTQAHNKILLSRHICITTFCRFHLVAMSILANAASENFSLMACTATGYIVDIRVVPGSNNDQNNCLYSELGDVMLGMRANADITGNEGEYRLLGDSGYGSSIVLLTSVENAAENSPEALYTAEHARARCVVKCTIGSVNGVFLANSRSRQLFYSPETVAKIVTASAILHSFRKVHGMPDFEPPRLRDDEDNNDLELVMDEALQAGLAERQSMIDLMYS
ncbi:hypothetical protein QAD02_011962 [Eretmocerus hayati]|uniref:Uncharacterized protein n=1 Tax=Eretmocerus hayati TaxID=131215 RepID=A0ACC2NYD5_9HYME|nr:hypothetical protein QAD02_011962 [Eretmocerus hayati]